MTTQHAHILDTAIAAIRRTTGIQAHLQTDMVRGHCPTDAVVEVVTDHGTHLFTAEVKTADRFATPAIIKAQRMTLQCPPMLIAPYVTREVAEHCRQLGLPFIDTAGNAYIEAPGLLVYVVGQARPVKLKQNNFTALNPAGLKLVFALLCRPKLLDENYRRIAADAGVALGTVGTDMKDLQGRGYFDLETPPHLRKLFDPKRMLEEWVVHYPITLRPKLNPARFRADPERLRKTDLTPLNACWGGEPAAEKLTRYLKPANFTIYTSEPVANLIAAGRMRAEAGGNVEILEKFWNFLPNPQNNEMPDVVPPILAYADLLATHDGRNLEAARMIYEQRIEPAFRGTQQ